MNLGKNAELILSSNTIARFVEGHLPPGWEIVMHFSSDECSMDLIDQDGTNVDYATADANESSIASAVYDAILIERSDKKLKGGA